MMDELDLKALRLLAENGRLSWAELSQRLSLSAPACADRVRKLEESGLIQGYAALIEPKTFGHALLAFVWVTFGKTKHRKAFQKALLRTPEVIECHHVTGEADFLLKVIARDAAHLEQLISGHIRCLQGVVRTRTSIVLSSSKDSPVRSLPFPPEAAK
jgi:Lrp/AsnC family transcriptional regulator, leucine-responsive regulatory protein